MVRRALPVVLMLVSGSGQAVDVARLMSDLTWEKRVLLMFTPDE